MTQDIQMAVMREFGEMMRHGMRFWLSETKVFEDYWTVEYKIPFAVLRFTSKDIQNWGINFFRRSTFLNEESFWNPINPEIDGFLNQAGEVTQLEDIETPYSIILLSLRIDCDQQVN